MARGNRPFVNGNGFWIGLAGIAAVMLVVVALLQGGREAGQRGDATREGPAVQAPAKQLPQPQ